LARDLSEGRTEQLVYYVFDLLYLDGFCLTAARLEDRKRALARILPPEAVGSVRYSKHVDGPGSEFFAECCRRGFEGIVSKRRDAPYTSGHGRDWLKTKCVAREEL
jgi:bifunctional non-homologous end joining protein LigD